MTKRNVVERRVYDSGEMLVNGRKGVGPLDSCEYGWRNLLELDKGYDEEINAG